MVYVSWPLARGRAYRIVQRPARPRGETTHWTSGAMAKHIGMSISSVQRIWRAHGLQPHKTRLFKLPNDPLFAEKVVDIVALYV